MRTPLLVGNWKMNGSSEANTALLQGLVSSFTDEAHADLAVCAPFVYLAQVGQALQASSIALGAQDVSMHLDGAYTGEVSASMLADLGCRFVIVGHSERRGYHAETNMLVAQKALAAIRVGLVPIVCLGETHSERESDATLRVVSEQLHAVQLLLHDQVLSQLVIAYEPVWAIGTGLTATPKQAQTVHRFIRQQLGGVGESVRLLYGGSVNADNASDLFAQPDIDGALVGGASLQAQSFTAIANAAI